MIIKDNVTIDDLRNLGFERYYDHYALTDGYLGKSKELFIIKIDNHFEISFVSYHQECMDLEAFLKDYYILVKNDYVEF